MPAGRFKSMRDQMKPVFKFSFNISFETQVDFASVQGDLVTYLMDFAEQEVKSGRVKL
jgi:hypothetical protein